MVNRYQSSLQLGCRPDALSWGAPASSRKSSMETWSADGKSPVNTNFNGEHLKKKQDSQYLHEQLQKRRGTRGNDRFFTRFWENKSRAGRSWGAGTTHTCIYLYAFMHVCVYTLRLQSTYLYIHTEFYTYSYIHMIISCYIHIIIYTLLYLYMHTIIYTCVSLRI